MGRFYNKQEGLQTLIKLRLYVHPDNSLDPAPDGIDPALTAILCTHISI